MAIGNLGCFFFLVLSSIYEYKPALYILRPVKTCVNLFSVNSLPLSYVCSDVSSDISSDFSEKIQKKIIKI